MTLRENNGRKIDLIFCMCYEVDKSTARVQFVRKSEKQQMRDCDQISFHLRFDFDWVFQKKCIELYFIL